MTIHSERVRKADPEYWHLRHSKSLAWADDCLRIAQYAYDRKETIEQMEKFLVSGWFSRNKFEINALLDFQRIMSLWKFIMCARIEYPGEYEASRLFVMRRIGSHLMPILTVKFRLDEGIKNLIVYKMRLAFERMVHHYLPLEEIVHFDAHYGYISGFLVARGYSGPVSLVEQGFDDNLAGTSAAATHISTLPVGEIML